MLSLFLSVKFSQSGDPLSFVENDPSIFQVCNCALKLVPWALACRISSDTNVITFHYKSIVHSVVDNTKQYQRKTFLSQREYKTISTRIQKYKTTYLYSYMVIIVFQYVLILSVCAGVDRGNWGNWEDGSLTTIVTNTTILQYDLLQHVIYFSLLMDNITEITLFVCCLNYFI